MNKDEAEKVIAILHCADGGCSYCVRELLEGFNCYFPEFAHLNTDWLKEHER